MIYLHFAAIDRIYPTCPECKGKFGMQDAWHWHSAGFTRLSVIGVSSSPVNAPRLIGPSVEQVQSRDGGFFWFLDLRFGHFDSAHGNHSTDGQVSRNAAYAQPEGPVQAVVQDNQHEEVLPMIGHPLGQSVVPHGCQETQYTQGTEKS